MVSETHINRKPGLWNIEVNFLTWKGSSTLITKNRKVGRDIPSSWLLVSEQLTGDSQGFHLLAAHSPAFPLSHKSNKATGLLCPHWRQAPPQP